MSTEISLSAIKAINEEKHRVQQYLEAIAKHKLLNNTQITIHTELESQTFIVTPQYIKLILEEMDVFFQARNIELTNKAAELVSPKPQTIGEIKNRLAEIHQEQTKLLDQYGVFGGGEEVQGQFIMLNQEQDELNILLGKLENQHGRA